MGTSSARPVDLIDYVVTTGYQHEAMPATGELDRLVGSITTSGAEWFTACYELPGAAVQRARDLASELDTWVGVVAAGFVDANGGRGADVVTLDDQAIIDKLPPLLADPPAEVRERVQEGQELYDALAAACEERDHERIQEILAELERRGGEDALMAGFGSRIGVDGQEAFEQMLEDGMRPKNREGFWGGVVDFFAGAWDAIWGTVTFLWDHSTIRMFMDPEGWAQSNIELGEALWHGIQNPGEFLEALIDWEGLMDNPERWFGQFAPDAVLAAFTAGSGTAARRGVAGARALDELGDLSRALRVVDDLDVAADTTHAFRRILNEFDGDLARTRDALHTYLVDELGMSAAEASARVNRIAGNEFNRLNRGIGTQIVEVELGPRGTPGVRVDAWDPVEGEIISRKFTQLGDILPSTARSYIDELVNKYGPGPDGVGQDIKITPTVRQKAEAAGLDPDALPTTLEGDLVLEVPPQTIRDPAAFQEILDHASDLGVIIRDTDGVVLNP
jgi:hypothetical protein